MRNTSRHQHGFAIHYLIWGLCVIAGIILIGFYVKYQIAVINEEKMYKEAEMQIDIFISDAKKLGPSTSSTQKYCSYSSAKYSKGHLGCSVRGEVEFGVTSDSQAESLSRQLLAMDLSPWRFRYDNTGNLLDNDRRRKMRVVVYGYENLICGMVLQYKQLDSSGETFDPEKYEVTYDCSSSALQEHYPTKAA